MRHKHLQPTGLLQSPSFQTLGRSAGDGCGQTPGLMKLFDHFRSHRLPGGDQRFHFAQTTIRQPRVEIGLGFGRTHEQQRDGLAPALERI